MRFTFYSGGCELNDFIADHFKADMMQIVTTSAMGKPEGNAMMDAALWGQLLNRMEAQPMDIVVISPPALTFMNSCCPDGSAARARFEGEAYGREGLDQSIKDLVKVESLQWHRAAALAAKLYDHDVPWGDGHAGGRTHGSFSG